MGKSKHTPGPWKTWKSELPIDRSRITCVYQEESRTIIVDIPHIPWPREEADANAHLIAAAPDLLEACENLENDDSAIPKYAWDMIQAAIAKAHGETDDAN